MYYEKNNARFLNVPILFSQHEHRILTGQKPYFKRVLPLFSRPYIHSPKNYRGNNGMEKNLTFRYDPTGDILYADVCSPYADQESEEIGDEIVARLNPTSGETENLEILFFSKRWNQPFPLQLPIDAAFRLVG
jgi:uncharacterized protein YuzE